MAQTGGLEIASNIYRSQNPQNRGQVCLESLFCKESLFSLWFLLFTLKLCFWIKKKQEKKVATTKDSLSIPKLWGCQGVFPLFYFVSTVCLAFCFVHLALCWEDAGLQALAALPVGSAPNTGLSEEGARALRGENDFHLGMYLLVLRPAHLPLFALLWPLLLSSLPPNS